MKIIVELSDSFDIGKAEKTFVKFKNGNVCRLLSMIQINTDGSNPIYIIPILEHIASGKTDLQLLEHIASGKTDLQLTDLKGIVKMMVGETE